MSNMKYFINHQNGSEAEEVDAEELQKRIMAGSVNAYTLIWQEGWAEWRSCGTLPEFLPLFQKSAKGRTDFTRLETKLKWAAIALVCGLVIVGFIGCIIDDDTPSQRQTHATTSKHSTASAAELRSQAIQAEDDGDYVKAVKLYTKAAEMGDAVAQNNLGICYLKGQGVSQNRARGAEWIARAAEQGVVVSQSILGRMYADGVGVPQNCAKAAVWLSQAAEQGDVDAQFYLGLLYAFGQGVPENQVLALQWLGKAADKGHEDAKAARALIIMGDFVQLMRMMQN